MFGDYCSQMGCLSSRSTTTVSPIDSTSNGNNSNSNSNKAKGRNPITQGATIGANQRNGYQGGNSSSRLNGGGQLRPKDNYSDSGTATEIKSKRLVDIGTSFDHHDERQSSLNQSSFNGAGADDEDVMSILMTERDKSEEDSETNPNRRFGRAKMDAAAAAATANNNNKLANNQARRGETFEASGKEAAAAAAAAAVDQLDAREADEDRERTNQMDRAVALPDQEKKQQLTSNFGNGSRENSFEEEELNVDMLRQYITVDFEISQLEDRDALRLYHEKIEQLEQLERELDMISFEAEEMAVRSETGLSTDQLDRIHSPNVMKEGGLLENQSILSGISMSPRSSIMRSKQQQQQQLKNNSSGKQQQVSVRGNKVSNRGVDHENKSISSVQANRQQQQLRLKENNLSYSTIEDVFNRKIILEKERDKLKKEVELVIIECDRLQQRYKKRDDILDKLFDGRTGNGLENHLEQQLIWLMEQKHYVDQVFYAWKRAETLTSQTCEQFASALELLKRLPKVQEMEQRNEIAKNICELLIKSRQDMEQAQRYNPNVDAPFFTDAETERFDKIIETLQSPNVSQSDYNQMATVVQFAYKRAVSIRLWLEQILQITIARDSFELAEEYKWIAIQLRKERISLINAKLQEAPYREMAREIREQLTRQQHNQLQHQLHQHHQQQQQPQGHPLAIQDGSQQTNQNLLAITDGKADSGGAANAAGRNGQNGEINRDSGVESDDIDIEEDIYRLLEMNKSRLEAAVAASREAGLPQAPALDAAGRPLGLRSQPQTPAKRVGTGTGGGGGGGGISMGAKDSNHSANSSSSQRDQMMRERIQKRRELGDKALTSSMVPMPPLDGNADQNAGLEDMQRNQGSNNKQQQQQQQQQVRNKQMTVDDRDRTASPAPMVRNGSSQQQTAAGTNKRENQDYQAPAVGSAASSAATTTGGTPSKLQIQLGEASRRNLLKQVDQVHAKHRNRLDNLRGNNKAKASDYLANKMAVKAAAVTNGNGAAAGGRNETLG